MTRALGFIIEVIHKKVLKMHSFHGEEGFLRYIEDVNHKSSQTIYPLVHEQNSIFKQKQYTFYMSSQRTTKT